DHRHLYRTNLWTAQAAGPKPGYRTDHARSDSARSHQSRGHFESVSPSKMVMNFAMKSRRTRSGKLQVSNPKPQNTIRSLRRGRRLGIWSLFAICNLVFRI